jgi:hypothetical protein
MGKLDKQLLAEELKKYKMLVEYDFYNGEAEKVTKPKKGANGDILLDEDPQDDEKKNIPADDSQTANGEGGADAPAPDANPAGAEPPVDNAPAPEGGAAPGSEAPAPEMPPAPAPTMPEVPAPTDNAVELDVTELVQGTEEAKELAMKTDNKMGELLTKFNELGASLTKMDGIQKKIEDLETQFEKRNPTPQEKLEMRSMDSFPYNLKLTDYWAEKEGTNYEATPKTGEDNEEDKEYVLTHDDVNSDYSNNQVKTSFDEVDDGSEANNWRRMN